MAIGFVDMWSEEVVEIIKEIELSMEVDSVIIGEDEIHLLDLLSTDKGLADGDTAALTHLYHLLDIHQGLGIALMEHFQRVFPDILGDANGYLLLPGLSYETTAHQGEGLLEVGNGIVTEEVRKGF